MKTDFTYLLRCGKCGCKWDNLTSINASLKSDHLKMLLLYEIRSGSDIDLLFIHLKCNDTKHIMRLSMKQLYEMYTGEIRDYNILQDMLVMIFDRLIKMGMSEKKANKVVYGKTI